MLNILTYVSKQSSVNVEAQVSLMTAYILLTVSVLHLCQM